MTRARQRFSVRAVRSYVKPSPRLTEGMCRVVLYPSRRSVVAVPKQPPVKDQQR